MDGNNIELLLNALKGVWAGNRPERGAGGGAVSEICAGSATGLQGVKYRDLAVCAHSIPIMLIGNWKEEVVTIHTFITLRAEHFINLIQQRNWKIRLMPVRIRGGERGPSKQPFAAIWLGVLEHILFEAIINMKRRLPPGPWLKYCSFFFFYGLYKTKAIKDTNRVVKFNGGKNQTPEYM